MNMTDSASESSSLENSFFSTKAPTRAELLADALKVVPDVQVLINMVSKRVRQFSTGHRPLVEITHRLSLGMIALKEIAEGKLEYKLGSSDWKN